VRQFFLNTDPDRVPRVGDTVALDQDESHHLFTVLRGGREHALTLVDGRGHRFTAAAAGQERRRARVRITAIEVAAAEVAPPRLYLACAVVKGKRFEWALEKAVEMGAHGIMPLHCEFGVVSPRSGKQERWTTILRAALKQSGRAWLPHLYGMMDPAAALTLCGTGPIAYGAVPGPDDAGGTPLVGSAGDVGEAADPPATLSIFIGPEGGWSPGETDALEAAGAVPVNLGPHVLRTETAAVAGLALLQTARGRWRQS
jgi:16S rRNA (uracil1498-N3)-methyltransferase